MDFDHYRNGRTIVGSSCTINTVYKSGIVYSRGGSSVVVASVLRLTEPISQITSQYLKAN